MGNYNPQAPILLGEQWVPIRNEDVFFAPQDDTVELGHGFTLTTPRQVNNARFYVNDPPPNRIGLQIATANIYPAGQEALSGPIQQVVIPCNAGAITGAGSPVPALIFASTVAEALSQPGDGKLIRAAYVAGGNSGAVGISFAVNQYPQLAGKRILNVSMEYAGYIQDVDINGFAANFISPNPVQPATSVSLLPNTGSGLQYGTNFTANTGTLNELADTVQGSSGSVAITQTLGVLNMGDVNLTWDDRATNNAVPWRYADLQRLEASATNRQQIIINFQVLATPNSPIANQVTINLEYVALRVTYCEETRVAVGGWIFNQYGLGANIIPMRDPTLFAANPVLAAAAYTATLAWVNAGDVSYGASSQGNFPPLNGARQLYPISSHPGVRVDLPFPLNDHIGDQFTKTSLMILPQISLHASGGTLTEPHVYGRQIAAQIYGSNVAQQVIYDDIVGVATSYPQVRYYARRWGSTTVPLLLSSTTITGAGQSVSITPTDFDALPEIVDGWREVTLRFTSAPSMGALTPDPIWQWSATGELAGNRWEVLGACAPAISGVAGNFFNQVPAQDRLSSATYQPPAGAATAMTWMPQGCSSPYVTGATLDPAVDAVLIFSQDPPTVTGLAISQLTQAVTGIGLNCGSLPCCIPSGIGYNRLTWSASSLAASGFGGYELQRFDVVTSQFQTIMLTTAVAAVTGTTAFNDFEARVGLASVYRIRAVNSYNFAGAWSTQVTGAPPTPGVTGGCTDMTGALIFTTNAAQQGNANAAYIMQWDDDVAETFGFPEAGDVQFQQFYGRDGSVAFHGTERGLEQFSRTLLVQAGAISLAALAPTMGNTNLLRNLAWGNYPYICVRDDLGNRWYATVQVPNVSVRNNRQSYMAPVTITETTQTPYAVSGS